MQVYNINNQWILEDENGARFVFRTENDMWEFLLNGEADTSAAA